MNNFKRPVCTRGWYTTHRARTRIQCTNNKNYEPQNISNSPKEPYPSMKDVLQVLSITTSLCSIVVNTSAIYTCYFELSDDLFEINQKLDDYVSRVN